MTLDEKEKKIKEQIKEVQKKVNAEKRAFARDIKKAKKLIDEYPELFKEQEKSEKLKIGDIVIYPNCGVMTIISESSNITDDDSDVYCLTEFQEVFKCHPDELTKVNTSDSDSFREILMYLNNRMKDINKQIKKGKNK